MTLGEKLRKARIENDLTLRQAAEKIGVTRNAIHLWEKDECVKTFLNISRAAEVLGLDLYDLAGMKKQDSSQTQTKPSFEAFCKKIEVIRKLNGLTQREMAKKLGIHYMTYYQWKKGNGNITLKNLISVANTFGVSVDYLIK